MEIRPELPDDHGLVALLYRQAFIGNYEVELVEAMREAGIVPIALVAMEDDELVGHILFTDVMLEVDDRAVPALALAEMAVHADMQRSGIGARLVNAGLVEARRHGAETVVVLGHPTYYPRFGFSADRARHLATPFRSSDAFMALELKPGSLNGIAGRVTYPPAFHLTPLR
ncbi:MAG: GNAT family N-acetyltransferase [Janthinobacterium lividum]